MYLFFKCREFNIYCGILKLNNFIDIMNINCKYYLKKYVVFILFFFVNIFINVLFNIKESLIYYWFYFFFFVVDVIIKRNILFLNYLIIFDFIFFDS